MILNTKGIETPNQNHQFNLPTAPKFTIGTGSITLTDYTATTFNVNGDSYVISGKQLVKK